MLTNLIMLFQWIKKEMYNSFIGCSGCGTSVYTEHWLPWPSHQFLHVWHTFLTSWWMFLLWGHNPSQREHGWNHIHLFVPPTHCPSRPSHFPVFSSVMTDFSFPHPIVFIANFKLLQSCMDVRVGLSAEELMLSNCDVGEDSWESFGLQGNQTSQS